jgi:hypothetical protein
MRRRWVVRTETSDDNQAGHNNQYSITFRICSMANGIDPLVDVAREKLLASPEHPARLS